MLKNRTVIYFTGDIYPEHWSGGADWLSKWENNTFHLVKVLYKIESQIYALMKKLRSMDTFTRNGQTIKSH